MANSFYRIGFCLMLLTCFFLTCHCEAQSLAKAWDKYRGSCECRNKYGYENNCAHYLSDALIRAGYNELDGGTEEDREMRLRNGFIVCSAGRPIRAKELRDWFGRKFTKHLIPRKGINAVYQERADGQGHVLLKKYAHSCRKRRLIFKGFRGTGDYPDWKVQEYYY